MTDRSEYAHDAPKLPAHDPRPNDPPDPLASQTVPYSDTREAQYAALHGEHHDAADRVTSSTKDLDVPSERL